MSYLSRVSNTMPRHTDTLNYNIAADKLQHYTLPQFQTFLLKCGKGVEYVIDGLKFPCAIRWFLRMRSCVRCVKHRCFWLGCGLRAGFTIICAFSVSTAYDAMHFDRGGSDGKTVLTPLPCFPFVIDSEYPAASTTESTLPKRTSSM